MRLAIFSRPKVVFVRQVISVFSFVALLVSLMVPPAAAGWPGGPPQPNKGNRPPWAVGPEDGDPVNLATGSETHTALPDIVVYNPKGPSAAYQRSFDSVRAGAGQNSRGLSPGWVDIYDVTIQGPANTGTWEPVSLIWQNGTSEAITPDLNYYSQPTGAMTLAKGAPYLVTGVPSSTKGYWQSFTLTYKSGTRWIFSPRANDPKVYDLRQIRDGSDNFIIIDRDPSYGYRLRSVKDSGGDSLLTFAYDGNGQLDYVTDKYNRKVDYTFGAAAGTGLGTLCLLTVSQITGAGTVSPPARTSYGYVARNSQPYLYTVSIPSPTGTGTSAVLTLSYDTSGNVLSQRDANGNQRVYRYNYQDPTTKKYGTRVDVKDATGTTVSWWVRLWDNKTGFNVSTGILRANGQYSYMEYTDPNNPSRPTVIKTDQSHPAVYLSYDQFGNVTSVTSPRGTSTSLTYDYSTFPLGRLMSVQEGFKTPTEFTYYEPSGLIKTVTGPAPAGSGVAAVPAQFEYDALGNVTKVTKPGTNGRNIVTTLNYTTDGTTTRVNMKGLPLMITRAGSGLSLTSTFQYDARGNVTAIKSPAGYTTNVAYNMADRPAQITFPATGQTGNGRSYVTYNYLYPNGNHLYAYGPLASALLFDESNAQKRQVSYTYDKQGNLLSMAGANETVKYLYDALDRIKEVRDGKDNPTKYLYDMAGYLRTVQYPGGSQTQYNYNLDGTLKERLDGRGTTTYRYDAATALSDIEYSLDRSKDVHLDWDEYGRLWKMTDGAGMTEYAYGDRDEMLSATTAYTDLSPLAVSYGYWENGRRRSLATPAGAFSYTYDGLSRPETLLNPFGQTARWTYQNGRLATQTLGNGAYTAYSWNPLGLLTQLRNIRSTDGAALTSFTGPNNGSIMYDAAGNVLQVQASILGNTQLSGATTYIFNDKDQLKQEQSTRNGGLNLFFDYDLAGNPTTYPKGTASQTGIPYNPDNQRTGPETFAYDGNGNPTTYRDFSGFSFDPANRFSQFQTVISSGYKGNGLRAWKQTSAGQTYFVYDGRLPVMEVDATGAVKAVNTFGAFGLLSRRSNGTNTHYTFDRQGTVTQRLGDSQNVLSTDLYDAFGRRFAGGYGSDPFGYAGRFGGYTDQEMGLVLMTYRYYDPATGRFLTRDPIGYAGGMNLYGYVGNNPVIYVDPLGLDWVDNTADFFAGAGDALTFGLTDIIRDGLGVNDVVNHCSGWYFGGEVAGNLLQDAIVAQVAAPVKVAEALDDAGDAARYIDDIPQCFPAGTPVVMADGTTKPIETVKEGETVLTRDERTGETTAKAVKRTFTREAAGLVALSFSTGEVIEATAEHPFYVAGKGFVPAGQIGIGTSIVTRAGPAVKVEKVERKPGAVTVYNVEVEDTHTYFVGTAGGGIWVHNVCNTTYPGEVTPEQVLNGAEKWLGPGYSELGLEGSGVYRSADGLRQFRMDPGSLAGNHAPGVPHVHFETFDPVGTPLANDHVPLAR